MLPRVLLLAVAVFACGEEGGSSAAAGAGAGNGGGGDHVQGGGTPASGPATSSSSGAGGAPGVGGAGGAGGGGGNDPLDGYGQIAGSCGEIDLEDLVSPDPQIVESEIDFSGRPPFDPVLLSPGGQEMYADGNLGGSSLYSEIFAFEVLARCEGATLLKTEAEIVYATQGKKTDILIDIDGEKVGVSVVRAMSFPEGAPYAPADALPVLEGKLDDILLSTANVAPEDAWIKQILAVVAQTPEHAASIGAAYAMLDDATRADTIVVVTVTEGVDAFIYYGN